MTYHGIHVLITHCQRVINLSSTLVSILRNLPKIRSISVVISRSQVEEYQTIIETYTELYTLDKTKLAITCLVYPDSYLHSKGEQVQFAFNSHIIHRRYHILWLREGERWVGNYPYPGWLPLDGGLIKVDTSGTSHWELRTFQLICMGGKRSQTTDISQWRICDIDGIIPTLIRSKGQTNRANSDPKISKYHGDYLILSNTDVNNYEYFVHPYYFYRNASNHLIKGEVELARQLFIRARRRHPDKEIKARSYLGQAICLKVQDGYKSWELIKSLLFRAFQISEPPLLEPLYFLLVWGLEFNQSDDVWSLVEKIPIGSLLQDVPPETSLLPYDTSCYHYLLLQTYLIYLDIFGDYTKGKLVLMELASRWGIPIGVRQGFSELSQKFDNAVDNLLKYENSLLETGITFKQRVTLTISKLTSIYLHSNELSITKLGQILTNSTDTESFISSGCRFILEQPKNRPGYHVLLEDCQGFYQASCYHLSNIGDMEEYIVKESPVYVKSAPQAKFTNWLKRKPKEFSQRKPLAFLLLGIVEPNQIVSDILENVTVTCHKRPISLDQVQEFQSVVILSSGNYMIDLSTLINCFQSGCHVLYAGCIRLYYDCQPHFNEYITNITGYSAEDIAKVINHAGEIIKAREPSLASHIFNIPNLVESWLEKRYQSNQLAMVHLSDSEVFRFKREQHVFTKVETIRDGLADLLQQMNDNSLRYGLFHIEGVLPYDNMRIAKHLVKYNLLPEGDVLDVVQLSSLNIDYLRLNARLVLRGQPWVWHPITNFRWKGTLLFSGKAGIERCLTFMENKSITGSIDNLIRAVHL